MPTIPATLRLAAARAPESAALVHGQRRYSYAELDAEVNRFARAMTGLGVAKGDRVALVAPNSDRFVITVYAAMRLGAIVVPVNPGAAAPELAYLLADSGAALLVFDPSLADTVHATQTRWGGAGPACAALGSAQGWPDLIQRARNCEPGPLPEVVGESDDALILYTSGTTGKPKGALFDHHRSIWVGVISISSLGLRGGDRILHVAPLYHAAELCILLIPGVMLGATHVVLDGFDPDTVLSTMRDERISVFFGVPTMYQLLLRHPSIGPGVPVDWRLGLFGAAPMPASAVDELVATLPGVELMQLCGQTEAGPGGIYCTHDQVRERPDASGRQPLMFTEAKVVNADGDPTGPGEVGELLLRGETVMKRYWNKPEATRSAIQDGWLHTGDLVRIDPDGYLTLVDRLKDMIITGGRNVYCVEVENAIAAHPDVLDCAVIARPHPTYGESILAAITPRPGRHISLDSIRTFCAHRITRYKLPHDILLGPIPRNASGKVLKHELRAAAGIGPTTNTQR